MKSSLLSLRDVVDIKDARLNRPQGKKDTVTVTGDMIDHTGKRIPVKLEAEVDNGQGIYFIQKVLGQRDFSSLDMIIKVK